MFDSKEFQTALDNWTPKVETSTADNSVTELPQDNLHEITPTSDNQIITVHNVHGYIDQNGTAWLNVEDVARGLGFTRIADSRNEVVRWERVNGYLNDFGFMPTSGHGVKAGDFIPENIFYRLAMKAKNAVAEDFQAKVADDILPAIRKHGLYATPATTEQLLNNPDLIIGLCQKLKEERAAKEQLQSIVEIQSVQISELQPKASYYDSILNSKKTMPIRAIAKDYGLSSQEMNKLLYEMKIQYPCNRMWFPYQNYSQYGYTKTTSELKNGHIITYTSWTQKGRLFLYNELKKHGILPLIERSDG